MRVKWLRRALQSLEDEAEYIARDDARAAAHAIICISSSVATLASHSALGRPGRVPGTRELVITGTSCIVPYRVRNEVVEILRVFHGARKWPSQF